MNRVSKGLAIPWSHDSQSAFAPFQTHGCEPGTCAQAARRGKFAFPHALLSSKTCGLHHAALEFRTVHAYFLRLSKIAASTANSG